MRKRDRQTVNFSRVAKAFKFYRQIKQFDPTPNKRQAKLNTNNKFMLTMNETSALTRMINC